MFSVGAVHELPAPTENNNKASHREALLLFRLLPKLG